MGCASEQHGLGRCHVGPGSHERVAGQPLPAAGFGYGSSAPFGSWAEPGATRQGFYHREERQTALGPFPRCPPRGVFPGDNPLAPTSLRVPFGNCYPEGGIAPGGRLGQWPKTTPLGQRTFARNGKHPLPRGAWPLGTAQGVFHLGMAPELCACLRFECLPPLLLLSYVFRRSGSFRSAAKLRALRRKLQQRNVFTRQLWCGCGVCEMACTTMDASDKGW